MQKKILVVLPTYSERENISILLPLILGMSPPVSVLCVNDYADDGSEELLQTLREKYSNLLVKSRKSKEGVASALLLGMQYGNAMKYDWVICMDADLSHTFQDLVTIVNCVNKDQTKEQIIIGSRYTLGGSVQNVPCYRKVISQYGNFFGRLAIGCQIKDVTSGFRAYSVSALSEILQGSFSGKGYGFQLQIIKELVVRKLAVNEIPITYVNRIHGKSKLSAKILLETFWTAVTLFVKRFI